MKHFALRTSHFALRTSHFKVKSSQLKWLRNIALPFLVFLFFTMNAFSQLTNSYQLYLTETCWDDNIEIGIPYVNVGVKLQPYNPQIGGPQKPHPTAQPTQFSDQNGIVFFSNLSCITQSFSVHYKINGTWMDYYTILEIDCTDGQPSYLRTVRLPDNFKIREYLSCDQGTRQIPNALFGRDVDCDPMKIHIPNQFFSNTGFDGPNEFILEVNRVNRNTGQVGHLTTFSFTSDDNPASKGVLASNNEYLGIENCSSGPSNLYIDFHKVMNNALTNSQIEFQCNQLLNLDVSLGVRCIESSKIPVWHLGWINYTVNNVFEGFDFDFTTSTQVDQFNNSPYQNGNPTDGLLNNVDTDPNGSGQGPLLGDNSAGITMEVDDNQLNCIESVKVYLYKYESCSAPWDPQNDLVQPGPTRSNPYDITNQFNTTTASVHFINDIVGEKLDQNSCYYVEVVVENTCGKTYKSGGRFQITDQCTTCRRVSSTPTKVQVYPTILDGSSEINVSFDHNTLTDGRFLIFDMKGLKQFDQKLPKQTKSAKVQVSTLPPGVYIAKVVVDGIYETRRIVVQ